jgi:hypothetical protein
MVWVYAHYRLHKYWQTCPYISGEGQLLNKYGMHINESVLKEGDDGLLF